MIVIIKAVILNCLRDRRNLMFMIFFPLFLVFLIGNTLSSYIGKMNNNSAIDELNIYYYNEGNNQINEVFNTFVTTVNENEDIEKVNIKEIDNIEEGKREVSVNRSIFLHLMDDTIEFYSNDESYIKSSLVYGILEGVVNRYNSVIEVFKINPIKGEEIIRSGENIDFIEEKNIPHENSPSSIDYYGVAEIGLMLFYFINYPLFCVKEDKRNNIKDRIKLSGISINKYYLSSFIGYFIFSFGVSLVTYILSNILFNVNYGDNLLIMPLAMIPFLILVNGLGVVVPIIFENDKVPVTILQNVVIPVLTFIGGGYIAIYGEMDGFLNLITKISPLRWFNSSIFRYIYSGDKSTLYNWMIFGFITLVVIIISIYLLSRKEDNSNEKYISIN